MHYFIDGYNLMFRVLRAGDNISHKRESVIQDLSQLLKLLQIDATLVFDSHYFPGESERHHVRDLEVIYTDEGESADQLILDLLKQRPDPLQETVVTSDKKLAWLARRRSAKTETVEQFFDWLRRRYKNKVKQLKNPLPVKEKKTFPPRRVKKEPFVVPPSNVSVEEAFQYYLETFEKTSLELNPPPKIAEKKEKEKKLSDYDRWIQAFTRILEERDGA